MAVSFGLEFFLQPAAHPFPTFGFDCLFHFPQRAGCFCFRAHQVPFVGSFSFARGGTVYAPIMVVVSRCAPYFVELSFEFVWDCLIFQTRSLIRHPRCQAWILFIMA